MIEPDPIPAPDHGLASTGDPPARADDPLVNAPADHQPLPPLPPVVVPDATAPQPHRQSAADPWAHRRGEPRVFAFLWTIYLLLAVLGSIVWVSRTSVLAANSYGPAARIMLVAIAAGAVVLWPMTRLSQAAPPEKGLVSCLGWIRDWLVVIGPVQLALWPLILLANWPAGIVAALSIVLAAWTALIAALLAFAFSGGSTDGPSGPARVAWMLFILSLAGAAPILRAVRDVAGLPSAAGTAMCSPFSAILSLTGRGVTGPITPTAPEQWTVLLATVATAVLAWVAVLAKLWVCTGRKAEGDPNGGGGGDGAADHA